MRALTVATLVLATALVLMAVLFGKDPKLAPATGAAEAGVTREQRSEPLAHEAAAHAEEPETAPATGERIAAEGCLRGRVAWTDGRPAAGAALTSTPQWHGKVDRHDTVADADGRFLFTSLPAGSYRLRVSHPRAIDDLRTAVEVRAGGTCELDVPLERGLPLAGRVLLVAKDGQRPAPKGWIVRAFPARGASRITRIEEDGAFRFEALPSGVHELVLWQRSWRTPAPVRASAGQQGVLIEVMRGEAVFAGRVTHPDGRPLKVFELEVLDEGTLRPFARTSRKGGNGTYRTPSLPPGTYRLRFLAGGRQPREVRAVLPPSGEVEIDVVLPELLAVRGVVLGATRRPLPGAHVQVLGEPPGHLAMDRLGLERVLQGLGGYSPGVFGNTDAEGRFSLPPQERASWVLVRDMDHAVRLVPVTGAAGGELEIRLARGVEVRGRVVDAEDRPVVGAQILLLPGGEPFDPRVQEEKTDGGGRFSFVSVGPGTWSVLVMRDRNPLPGAHAGAFRPDLSFEVSDSDLDLGDLR